MKRKTRRRMTRKQQQVLRKRLLARRSRLLRGLQAQLVSLRQGDQGRASDIADIASDALRDLESLQVAELEAQELKKIEGAIRRIDAGTFDVCEECGGAIGKARLQALPHATLCLRCQERLEDDVGYRQPEEHWGSVVESEEDLERSVGTPDERLDAVERRH